MDNRKSAKKIKRILCPTDLSFNSQLTVRLAAVLAERLAVELMVCHCAENKWLSGENHLSGTEAAKIKNLISNVVKTAGETESKLEWQSLVVENSSDVAQDIINLGKQVDVDLIVMKARKGVLSAFHYGSIVERVVSGAWCPVLLVPTRFLEAKESTKTEFDIRNILVDYEFSREGDKMLDVALDLSDNLYSRLHLLKVLEPHQSGATELAPLGSSQEVLGKITIEKLHHVIANERQKPARISPAVRWGEHSETVLHYAAENRIDLICATLPPPHFYFEKMYSVHLGKLLQKAACPILVLQTQGARAPVYFKPVVYV